MRWIGQQEQPNGFYLIEVEQDDETERPVNFAVTDGERQALLFRQQGNKLLFMTEQPFPEPTELQPKNAQAWVFLNDLTASLSPSQPVLITGSHQALATVFYLADRLRETFDVRAVLASESAFPFVVKPARFLFPDFRLRPLVPPPCWRIGKSPTGCAVKPRYRAVSMAASATFGHNGRHRRIGNKWTATTCPPPREADQHRLNNSTGCRGLRKSIRLICRLIPLRWTDVATRGRILPTTWRRDATVPNAPPQSGADQHLQLFEMLFADGVFLFLVQHPLKRATTSFAWP